MAEPDRRDWFALNTAPQDYRDGLEDGVKGLRITYSRNLGYAEVDAEVEALVGQAVKVFADLGAEVEEIDPGFADPQTLMALFWSVGFALLVADVPVERWALMDEPILELAERGRAISAVEYRQAEGERATLGRQMSLFHARYDLLLTPQLPLTAFEAGREFPADRGMSRWWQWSPFTYPFNLTQQPAATVPCGFASDGLPVALQIVGDKFADALVLRACRAYESRHPFEMAQPDTS
jgi:aspartyl-tRNA(Asn)/glutamyl-tRNA(Gln) amidotransferase subunit A